MKSNNSFEAVIFDLDGVITKTALVHSAAWKKMFDEYLLMRSQKYQEEFREFTHENDYLPFVDGKPRYKGVESFLQSRNINLPFGDPQDSPGTETICGLGNRKNEAFNEVLARDGVEVYESTIDFIHELKSRGIKVGVASSSKNCKSVLKRAGILDLFETRVDGEVSAQIGLKGKPEPDIFTTAADNLGIPYDKTVVVEDAVSGVEAGSKGNFGLVIGIAREDNEQELLTHGADLVVKDIADIGFSGVKNWFDQGLETDNWSITYHDYVKEKEKTRETLLTIGNGYFGTRGAMEETDAGEFNYPGTYMAGLYNRLISQVGDREVENEDFVNCPNWLPVKVFIGDEELNPNTKEILQIYRNLDFRTGILHRTMKLKDSRGRITQIGSERLISMANRHHAVLRYSITPLNHNEMMTVRTGINGAIINDGVTRYRQLNQRHLKPVEEGFQGPISWVNVRTTQSGIGIAVAARIKIADEVSIRYQKDPGYVMGEFTIQPGEGRNFSFEKIVSVHSSQAWDSPNPLDQAKTAVSDSDFDTIVKEGTSVWEKIWNQADIQIEGDRRAQKLLRMHVYHLFASLSPHNTGIDASITARGLHGEAYRGHIFWDELFILPLYNLHFPEVVKATLMYRYRRLDAARAYAKEHGYRGAMFPWQSGSDGREETQVVHLNPLTGNWGPDYSSLQRHVSLAIAYNIWLYVHVSEDVDFLAAHGAEMFLEICRFWASKAYWDDQTQRFSINQVMGPDEFHEKYPGNMEGGLKDNTYTNIMAAWAFEKALELLSLLTLEQKASVFNTLHLSIEELDHWQKISENLNIVIEGNILAQYDGYFHLKELDWDYYRQKYGNVYRMDRLLKAEGKSADDYKVAKQADTLQTFYNLDEQTVTRILSRLGIRLAPDYLEQNLKYYLARTSHGSTLSRVVHAQLANIINNKQLSWELYLDALTSDYADIQGGTTGEGIHAGVMAGTVLIAIQSFAGIDLKSDMVKINPHLPDLWRAIQVKFTFKNVDYLCRVGHDKVAISHNANRYIEVEVGGKLHSISPGISAHFQINK